MMTSTLIVALLFVSITVIIQAARISALKHLVRALEAARNAYTINYESAKAMFDHSHEATYQAHISEFTWPEFQPPPDWKPKP
jgi:hypothetical protein